MFLTQTSNTSHVVDDKDVGCHRSNMCVMCSKSVPTLFQYFFYDHIPTFLYIFHEMFFITCKIRSASAEGARGEVAGRDVTVLC